MYEKYGADDKEILELLERCRDGGKDSISRLWLFLSPIVFNRIYGKLCGYNKYENIESEAEAYCNDVFLKLMNPLRSCDFATIFEFDSYLNRIIKSVLIDNFTKSKKDAMGHIDEFDSQNDKEINTTKLKKTVMIQAKMRDPKETPDNLVEKEQLQKKLHELINQLPLNSREIIRFYTLKGVDYKDISKHYYDGKVSATTLRQRHTRALKDLSKLFEANGISREAIKVYQKA